MYIHIELCIKRVIGLTIFCIITLKDKFSKFSSIFLKKPKKTQYLRGFFLEILGGFFLKKPSGFYNGFFNRANPGLM